MAVDYFQKTKKLIGADLKKNRIGTEVVAGTVAGKNGDCPVASDAVAAAMKNKNVAAVAAVGVPAVAVAVVRYIPVSVAVVEPGV